MRKDDDRLAKAMQRSASKDQPTEIAFNVDGMLTILTQDGAKCLTLEYELADTPERRAQGLMYRKNLDELRGMLFAFDDAAPRFMYMKNTYIPLDILFLDSDKKIIKIYKNTEPCSEDLLPSVRDARYALEVNAGFCAQHGVQEGDSLNF